MLQCLLGCYSLLGVVYEYSPQEIEELPVEVSVGGDCFLCMLVTVKLDNAFKRTGSFFIAFTYFFDALLVSALG